MGMPSEQERALHERVREQARLEQARDVDALCGLILPAYRASAEKLSRSAESLGQFVGRVRTAEFVSFEVERWEPTIERFGGAPAAVVRTVVRYNELPEPTSFRTIWVFVDSQWFTTAVGKLWPDDSSAAPSPAGK